MLALASFPMHNIVVLLFLDVVKWHNSESTTLMRYKCPEVNKFWRIGYKIFNSIPEVVMPSSYKTPDEYLDFLYVQKRILQDTRWVLEK
jgi:hypothetical protein